MIAENTWLENSRINYLAKDMYRLISKASNRKDVPADLRAEFKGIVKGVKDEPLPWKEK